MTWIIANLLGIATGIVIKILVPLPFLDDPVRSVYRWVKRKVTG